jgi:iron complex outermembrane receptor protein
MSNNKMYGVSVMVGALLGTMPMEGLAIEDESEKAGAVTELPVIEVQGSTRRGPDELPSMYTGGQQARGARVGLLGNKDLMETPFSITSYTAQTIKDQQARTVADVMLNDASVRSVNPSSGRFEQFSIRGFTVLNSEVAFGGLYGIVPTYSIPVEATERVEIIKGPNALLNGMAPSGGVGGTINVVPKRAVDRPVIQLTGSYLSDSQFGGHVDIGRRFGKDNRLGIRLNSVYQNGDTPFRHQSIRRNIHTLALDFRGEALRLFADVAYQDRRVEAPLERVGVVSGVKPPSARRVDSGMTPSWTDANVQDIYGVFRVEYDISPVFNAYAAIGARRGDYDFMRATVSVKNAGGDFMTQPFQYLYKENALSAEAGLHAMFETGAIMHAINLGMSDFRLEYGNARQSFDSIQSNIFNPVEHPEPVTGGLSHHLPIVNKTHLSSIALTDTLSILDEQIQLTLGARIQQVEVNGYSPVTGSRTKHYNKDAVTPAVGLLVKPWKKVSLYANYIEALTQGPTPAAGAVNINDIFPPSRTKQVEAGIKMDFGKLMTTVSLFKIRQPSGFTNPATLIFAVDGKQQNKGAEINVFGEPFAGIRIQGGVMYLDGELTKTAGGINDGNTAPGVPKVAANLGGEWDIRVVPGLTLTARSIYTSAQYLDAANTQKIPSWVRFDLGARYAIRHIATPVTIRANILNAFDKQYWSSAAASGLTLGDRRTLMLSATVDF